MKTTLLVTLVFLLGAVSGVTITTYEYDANLNAIIKAACPVPMSETAYDACVVRALEGR